jgi:RNA polymerase sigma-70 factor (ECF subfamily)
MVLPPQSEKILIDRAIAGDANAFGELYTRHLDPIYRYIFFRVGEQEEAEDLTETVFLKAWEAIPGYKDFGNPFSSWLYRIAHNMVVDFHRKIKTVPNRLEADEPIEIVDESLNTLGMVIEAEQYVELGKAIAQLTAEQQQVIVLRFIEDMSHAEIAKIIGKNEGTCRMIQHRALVALSKLLGENARIIDND